MTRTPGRRARASALALAALLLTACTGEDMPTAPSPDGQAQEQDAPDAGAAAVEQVGEPLASQTLELGGGDAVDVGVLGLEVDGEVVQLRLSVTPRFASEPDDARIDLFSALGETSFDPTLLDLENLEEYRVVRDGLFPWATADTAVRTANGSPVLAWAWFAAPGAGVDSLDVRVTDAMPLFTDVPVTR